MEKKVLPIKEQIEVLTCAKDFYLNGKCGFGMCSCIDRALSKLGNIGLWYDELKDFIPLFTLENMRMLSERGLIEPPMFYSSYWWPMLDREIRPLVFDVLISELEKQL